MRAREFLEILHTAERLKDTLRHCTTSLGRRESVAEHSWRLALAAFLAAGEFPQLDTDRVIAMCLVHDLGECFTGDIPTFLKTDADRGTEAERLESWLASLPEDVSERTGALLRELEEGQTPEARLCRALDKMEALIQHNESPLSTWSDNEHELNRTYAFDAAAFDPWLSELRREILADTLEKEAREGRTDL
ncbi:MAG: HD domain-containing protein [Oscillospiraceae bacterium]|nr:HD domain-containing protein [Oscillospiraceae bacterium]